MNTKDPLRRQMAEAYGETSAFGRLLAVALSAIFLTGLFVYRAVTTDPLWPAATSARASTR